MSQIVTKVAVALLAGIFALVILFPASGVDTQPPECYSIFGYSVPCGSSVAVVAAAATIGVAGILLWLIGRRNSNEVR